MYVCLCKGVTENAIREAIYQGADRMRDLKASLGVTEQCGICACHAKQVLDETLVQKSQVRDFISQPACRCETAARGEETVAVMVVSLISPMFNSSPLGGGGFI
ncbi:MAG: bacterioferritin-associated ferredoxin [Nitrosomonas sp.]|nr:bacterioferritin-associated ferredoxin [Nitrosomonas sp.]